MTEQRWYTQLLKKAQNQVIAIMNLRDQARNNSLVGHGPQPRSSCLFSGLLLTPDRAVAAVQILKELLRLRQACT